jgi:hypothetical protein
MPNMMIKETYNEISDESKNDDVKEESVLHKEGPTALH